MSKNLNKIKEELEKAKTIAAESRVAFEADNLITDTEKETLEKLEKTVKQLSELVDALEDKGVELIL